MKKVITTVLAASLMLVATNAFAQLSAGAGYINATDKSVYTDSKGNKTITNTPLNGFYAGVQYDMPVVLLCATGKTQAAIKNFTV